MDNTDITKLITSLGDWQRWILVPLIALFFGSLGGLTKRLTTPATPATEATPATPTTERLPLQNYLVVGAVASVAVLFVSTPTDGVKLLAQSIAAGYVGQAILDALGDKIKLALKIKENEELKNTGALTAQRGLESTRVGQYHIDQEIIIKGKHGEGAREISMTTLQEDTKRKLALIQGELEHLEWEFKEKR